MLELQRDIKLDLIAGKYKAISAYKIPKDIDMWLVCPNCNLKPLVWEFNNGRSTACDLVRICYVLGNEVRWFCLKL